MKDLIEMLDRAAKLDDSAKKPLTDSVKGDAAKKLKDAASSVKCRLTPGFKRYALETPDYVDNIIEDELLYCGNALCKEFPNMKYWKFGEKSKLTDLYGNYCVVETGTDEGKILVQLDGHGRIYHLEESVNQLAEDYDFNDNWAHSIFTDDVNGKLIGRLGNRLHDDRGVPVRCEYSQWNYGELVYDLFDTHPVVLTEENLESIVDKICSAYASWKENINCDAPDAGANDWYNDTGAADDDGWPNDAMSDDPDYCHRVNDWWDAHRWEYEDDEDYDDYDNEDVDESLRSQRGKTVNEAVKKDTKIERPKGYKGTVGGYLSVDRYGTFVSRKTDSGGVQISSANYDWIKDNFDLVEQPNLEYKTMWGRGVVYKIVEKK